MVQAKSHPSQTLVQKISAPVVKHRGVYVLRETSPLPPFHGAEVTSPHPRFRVQKLFFLDLQLQEEISTTPRRNPLAVIYGGVAAHADKLHGPKGHLRRWDDVTDGRVPEWS